MDDATAARFWSKVNQDGEPPADRPDLGPCWLWKPRAATGGYGQFHMRGKNVFAHRAAYESVKGPIAPGLTIDHLCRVRPCVNPTHLEAVTLAENLRRAKVWEGGAAFQRNKLVCKHGHPYSGDNLHIAPDGKRVCRECSRRWAREHAARQRAANPPPPKPVPAYCAQGRHVLAEVGVLKGKRTACAGCSRDKVQQFRARKRAAAGPRPVRTTCKNGHPWVDANIYVNPNDGQRACKACHNARTLAAYHARRAAQS